MQVQDVHQCRTAPLALKIGHKQMNPNMYFYARNRADMRDGRASCSVRPLLSSDDQTVHVTQSVVTIKSLTT